MPRIIFIASASTLTDPPFMGVIVIRIGVASSAGNYHVPLLVSPYGYVPGHDEGAEHAERPKVRYRSWGWAPRQ